MSFSDFDVPRRTRKENFLNQIDQLIDWISIEQAIAPHYAPASDAIGRTAYPGLLRFLGLNLEDDVPDHSVLSRFRTRLTAARAWDGLACTD